MALFRLENIGRLDATLERMQRASGKVIQSISAFLENAEFLNGKLVTVKDVANTFEVSHKLGRIPKGFIVVYMERAAGKASDINVFYRTGEAKTTTNLALYISGDAGALSLWIF